MPSQRRLVLTALTALLFAVAGIVLHRVLGTVFLAITAAYLLVPVQRRVIAQGIHEWWAATVVTIGTTIAALVPVGIASYLAASRLSPVLGFLTDLPDVVSVTYLGFSYTLVLADLVGPIVTYLRGFALDTATALPVLLLKVTLFVILVFALLIRHEEAEEALVATIPHEYHDIVDRLGTRARETLYAIYVLQAATAIGTFLIAVPVFVLLGYPFPFTLALLAAILQFIPIVGPSILVAALGGWKLLAGDVTAALLIFGLGGALIAWLPDILIRPRLSQSTARLPGSLYFIGFIGGLLTVGAIGVVAGPLAIALAVSAMEFLAEVEVDRRQRSS